MLEWLGTYVTGEALGYVGGITATAVVGWIFKKIPNATIKAKFGAFCYGAGVACTLGLAKWKWTSKVWNKTIEPYFIDFLDNVFVHGLTKFKDGMRSDG